MDELLDNWKLEFIMCTVRSGDRSYANVRTQCRDACERPNATSDASSTGRAMIGGGALQGGTGMQAQLD